METRGLIRDPCQCGKPKGIHFAKNGQYYLYCRGSSVRACNHYEPISQNRTLSELNPEWCSIFWNGPKMLKKPRSLGRWSNVEVEFLKIIIPCFDLLKTKIPPPHSANIGQTHWLRIANCLAFFMILAGKPDDGHRRTARQVRDKTNQLRLRL